MRYKIFVSLFTFWVIIEFCLIPINFPTHIVRMWEVELMVLNSFFKTHSITIGTLIIALILLAQLLLSLVAILTFPQTIKLNFIFSLLLLASWILFACYEIHWTDLKILAEASSRFLIVFSLSIFSNLIILFKK